MSYQWSFVARPQGSDAVIADSTAESITFTADRAGSYTVQLVVNDGALDSAPATETVTVEPGLPLAIESLTPVDGSSVADENIEIIIQLNQSAITHLGEIPYVTDANNQITLPLALLEGVNSVTLTFDNQLGQTVEETITYHLDTIAPPKPDATAITVSVVGNEMLVSGGAGSVEPGSLVTLTNQETEVVITVVAEADGSFSALVTAAPQDTIGITSTDAATNVSDVLVVRGSTVDPDHSSSLTGQVINTDEQLVSGAVIKAVNLSSTMVDAQTISQNGGYQLQLNAATGYLLKITAAGYADQYRVVETAPVEQSQVTDIVMVPRAAPETLDEDEGGQVQTAEGAAVTLPGNSVEAALGTGAIALTVTGLDVTDGIVYAAIPGTLAGTTDQGGYDLEINGLIEITLRDATGETLELLDTVEAQVVIPVYANDDFFVANPLTHGDTVALWTLDAATGTWIADGEAEVVLNERSPTGLAVVTTVSPLAYHAIGTRIYHNSAPVAVISGELSVTAGDEISLNANASSDPEEDPLSYTWSLLSQPQDSQVQLPDPTAETITFNATHAGNYRVQLIVNDSALDSAPVSAEITVEPGEALLVESIMPVDGSWVAEQALDIIIQLNQPAVTTVDDTNYTTDELNSITIPVSLAEGENTYTLVFENALGETAEQTVIYYLDTIAPPTPDASAIEVYVAEGEITVSGAAGSVEPGSVITLTNVNSEITVTVTAGEDGSFSAVMEGAAQDKIKIQSSDAAFNVSEVLMVSGSTVDPDDAFNLSGRVSTLYEEPVEGAVISAINQTTEQVDVQTLSRADGSYDMVLNASVEYVLQVTSADYTDQVKAIEALKAGESQIFDITLIYRTDPDSFIEDQGGEVQGEAGASVTTQGNSFEEALGTGAIAVVITPLDVTDDGIIYAMPGELSGTSDQGEEFELDFYGAVEIEFTDAEGNELDLVEGVSAQISIPVFDNSGADGAAVLAVGDSVPVWTMLEATGEWVEEGVGAVVANGLSPSGLVVAAEVSHFSYYAVGRGMPAVVRASVSDFMLQQLVLMAAGLGDDVNEKLDSDGDGVPDGEDAFPFDDTRAVSCEAGAYGAFECMLAEPGTYVQFEGFISPLYCEIGSYAEGYGNENCMSCPDGLTTVNVGSKEVADCEPNIGAAEDPLDIERYMSTSNSRSSISNFESVSPYDGLLQLRYLDTTIQGHGGFDLPVNRIYNTNPSLLGGVDPTNKVFGRQWDIHFGRIASDVKKGLNRPWFCPLSQSPALNPIYEGADGSRYELFPMAESDYAYFGLGSGEEGKSYATTKAKHRVVCDDVDGTVEIHSPDGMKYYFGMQSDLSGSLEAEDRVVFNLRLHVTKVEDRNGNYFSFRYKREYDIVENRPGAGNDRGDKFTIEEVSRGSKFDYPSVAAKFVYKLPPNSVVGSIAATPNIVLDYIQVGGRKVVEYDFENITSRYAPHYMSQVTYLSNSPSQNSVWKYEYYRYGVINSQYQIHKVTHPGGGVTTYSYDKFIARIRDSIYRHVRVVDEVEVGDVGTWSYVFSDNNDGFRVAEITDTENTKRVLEHCSTHGYPGKCKIIGNLYEHSVYESSENELLEKIEYEWVEGGEFTSQHQEDRSAKFPRMRMKTVKRGADVLTTMLSSFDTYDNPRYKVEIVGKSELQYTTNVGYGGDNLSSRVTEYEYENKKLDWLLGLVKEVNLKDVSDVASDPVTDDDQTVAFVYDTKGNIKTETSYGYPTNYIYDGNGNVEKITDPNGNKTVYENYVLGVPEIEKQSMELGGEVVLTKEREVDTRTGLVKNQTVHRSENEKMKTEYSYDAQNRIVKVKTPKPDDADINIVYYTDRTETTRGVSKQSVYFDEFGRREKSVVGEGNVAVTIEYESDLYDRVVYKTFPYKSEDIVHGKKIRYDALGRMVKEWFSNDTLGIVSSTYSYDGLITTMKDRNNNVYISKYRAYGSFNDAVLIETSQPISIGKKVRTQLSRAKRGDVLAISQDAGSGSAKKRSYKRDGAYRIVEEESPEVGKVSSRYDDNGNKIYEEYKNNNKHYPNVFEYNGRNQLELIDYGRIGPDVGSSYIWGADDIRYEYYNDGRLKSASTGDQIGWVEEPYWSNGETKWTYVYDLNGNLTDEKLGLDLDEYNNSYTFKYGYNDRDAVSSLDYPSNRKIEYSPDIFGRPTKLGNYMSGISYHSSGRVHKATYGNETKWETEDNDLHFTTKNIYSDASGNELWSEAFELYDNNFNVKTHVTTNGGKRGYEYDGINRVTSISLNGAANEPYEYDVYSNIEKQSVPLYGQETTMTYDLATLLPEAGVASDGELLDFRHDRLGNEVTDNNTEGPYLYFDNANRLRNISDNTFKSLARYTYDAHGRRVSVWKPGEDGGSTGITIYGSGGNLLHSLNPEIGTESDFIYLGRKLIARYDVEVH